jgi:hypothetical protein
MKPSYRCPKCGLTSYHPMDVYQRYCGHCKTFEDDGIALTSASHPTGPPVDEDADLPAESHETIILEGFKCEGCGVQAFALPDEAHEQFCPICFVTSKSPRAAALTPRQYLAMRRMMGHEERNMGHPPKRRRCL